MECPIKLPSCLRTPKPEPPSDKCCCCPCDPPEPPTCPCQPCPPCPPCCPKPCSILVLLGRPGPCPFSDSFLPETDLDFDVDIDLMDWGIATPEGFNYEKNRKKFIINKPLTCCDCCECTQDGGIECADGDCIFAPVCDSNYDTKERDVCPTQRKKICSLPPCSRSWDSNADTCVTREGDEPLPSCLPTFDGSCRPSPFCIRTHSPCFIPNCMRCYGCPPPACICLDEPKEKTPPLVYKSPEEPPVRQSSPVLESKFAPCPYAPEPQSCCQSNNPPPANPTKNPDHDGPSHEPQPPCPLTPKCPPCDGNNQGNTDNCEDSDQGDSTSQESVKGCPKTTCCCSQSKKSTVSQQPETKTSMIDRLESPPCTFGCEKSDPSKNGKEKGKCPCKETQDYCPVKTEACKLFPKGRCPMGDLGTCDCDYPVPPCMAPPKCGDMPDAPEQYCVKEECCMGLPFPPTQPSVRDDQYGQEVYYKFCDRKPGRDETKHFVEVSEEPLDNDIFPKRERQHPTWTIIPHGKGYEKCKTVQDILRKRGPSKNLITQYDTKDCPLTPLDIATISTSRTSPSRT